MGKNDMYIWGLLLLSVLTGLSLIYFAVSTSAWNLVYLGLGVALVALPGLLYFLDK